MRRIKEAIALYRIYRQVNPLPVALRVAWRAIRKG